VIGCIDSTLPTLSEELGKAVLIDGGADERVSCLRCSHNSFIECHLMGLNVM